MKLKVKSIKRNKNETYEWRGLVKLNLGSGPYLAPGYINVDKFFTEESLNNHKDKTGTPYEFTDHKEKGEFVERDILDLPFEDNYADIIEAHQVIEHIPMHQQELVYKEIYRVLKPNGKLKISVPSFNGLCLEWLGMELRSSEFNPQMWYERAQEFYGIQVNEGEYHRCPQTTNWIAYCLGRAGFTKNPMFALFPKSGAIPNDEKFGIMATSPKPYGNETVFRHETIFMEVEK
jgi:SAM-dependent methyltransferase